MGVLADYECPQHGVFEALADGDATAVPCPRWVMTFEHAQSPSVRCQLPSPWVPSPVHGRVKLGEMIRGGSDERPPESRCMDTRPLADGMPVSEWRNKQLAINRDIALKKARAKL